MNKYGRNLYENNSYVAEQSSNWLMNARDEFAFPTEME
jgi:hypothetical protein